jgi:hypothetical protein
MRRAPAVLLLALVAVTRDGWTQGGIPIGPEFQVNTYATGSQGAPSVSADPEARFVVVWHSDGQDGSGLGVFGQRYFITGIPQGPEFRVSTFTTGDQYGPSAAMTGGGNFVVAWTSTQDGSGFGVFGQRFFSSGAPAGSEFRVNSYTAFSQYGAAAATGISGNFVIVWSSMLQDGSGAGVFGQRYAGSGVPIGPEFRVNSYTFGYQYHPAVASDFSGNFVVVWQDGTVGGGGAPFRGIFGQRYDSSGAPVGPEFQVQGDTAGFQGFPAVAADAAGDFVVVWYGYGDGSSLGVFGQRYSGSGVPLGSKFPVNTQTSGQQAFPAVTADGSGNFVVVWGDAGQDGSGSGVFGQRFTSTGTPLGAEFRVNTYTTDAQAGPSVASIGGGTFVVTWHSLGQDGSAYGVFSQRYNTILPVELMQSGVE